MGAAWAGAIALGAGPSAAQSPDPPAAAQAAEDVYPRAFFDRFAPQTALDLLARLPGFTLGAGADLRGFGGGAGNVLIDGQRPTIKAGGLEEVLRRIPADTVDRIELSRGAQRAGETAGQGLVANVVRKSESVAGTWSAELERNIENLVYPRAEVSVTAPVGAWRTTTRLNGFWEQFPFKVYTRQRLDADGALLLFEEETLPSTLLEAFASTEAKRPWLGGALTVNLRIGNSRFYQETGRDGFFARLPDGNPDRRTDIRFDSEYFEGELSADWTRTVAANWSLKGLALASARDTEQSSKNVVQEPVGETAAINRFAADRFTTEFLSRATLGRVDGRLRPEFGAEVAYNRLESQIGFEVEDAGGTSPVDLPASDVEIEEIRAEAFGTLTWIASPKWTVEAGLAAEASEITVGGNAMGESTFFFAKPSLAITRQISERIQLRAAVRRTVGQLNFNDFAASANAEDDRFLGGNPDLGPDQTTRASLTADLRAPSGAAVNVELFHEWREDVLEQVTLPSGAFGVANAGSARVWGIEANGSLPLNAVIPGGLLEADIAIRESEFDDPVSGEVRDVDELRTPEIEIDFRQDLSSLQVAWGVTYAAPYDVAFFFADEIDAGSPGATWTGFVETTRFFGVKTQLEVRNIGGWDLPRERQFFSPDRGGVFTGSELQDRRRGAFIKLTVSDQF
ncbi:MAG: TonB-dependent receptor [Pseudomonadota bacterium]